MPSLLLSVNVYMNLCSEQLLDFQPSLSNYLFKIITFWEEKEFGSQDEMTFQQNSQHNVTKFSVRKKRLPPKEEAVHLAIFLFSK